MQLYSALDGPIPDDGNDDYNSEIKLPGTGPTSDSVAPADIIGEDDRRVFFDYRAPWHLVGYLEYDDGRNATGVLIGKKLVLTCYHCIQFSEEKTLADFHFVPGKYSDPPKGNLEEPFGRFKVKNAYWYGDDRPDEDTSGTFHALDFAVLELDRETGLGSAACVPLLDHLAENETWKTIGYPAKDLHKLPNLQKGRPVYQKGIKVSKVDNHSYKDAGGDLFRVKKLVADADIEQGQSGSPLFRVVHGNIVLSGLLSGESEVRTVGPAYDLWMSRLIDWTRKNVDR